MDCVVRRAVPARRVRAVLQGRSLSDPRKSREGVERQAGSPFRHKKDFRPVYHSRPQQEANGPLKVVGSKEGV